MRVDLQRHLAHHRFQRRDSVATRSGRKQAAGILEKDAVDAQRDQFLRLLLVIGVGVHRAVGIDQPPTTCRPWLLAARIGISRLRMSLSAS